MMDMTEYIGLKLLNISETMEAFEVFGVFGFSTSITLIVIIIRESLLIVAYCFSVLVGNNRADELVGSIAGFIFSMARHIDYGRL